MQYFVEVFYNKNYGDKKIASIKNRLEAVGLKNILQIMPSIIYKLEGNYARAQIENISSELLADPVLETYKAGIARPKGFFKVQVWIRDSSTDVVGESVRDAISAMNYEKPALARVCNAFAIKGNFTKERLETAVKKTFVNEVVNKFSVEEF